MNFDRKLDKIMQTKNEEELRRKAAKAHGKTSSKHSIVIEGLPSRESLARAQVWIDEYSDTIRKMLTRIGQTLWGKDSFTLILINSAAAPRWYVVHENWDIYSFEVSLLFADPGFEAYLRKMLYQDPSLLCDDYEELVSEYIAKIARDNGKIASYPVNRNSESIGFKISGKSSFTCGLSTSELEKALLDAFRSGPKVGHLDTQALKVLQRTPYKRGETELKARLVIPGALSGIVAGVHIVYNSTGPTDIIGASIFIILSIALLAVTRFGKQFTRLTGIDKTIASLAAFPAAIGAAFILFILVEYVLPIIVAIVLGIVVLVLMFFGAAANSVMPVISVGSKRK